MRITKLSELQALESQLGFDILQMQEELVSYGLYKINDFDAIDSEIKRITDADAKLTPELISSHNLAIHQLTGLNKLRHLFDIVITLLPLIKEIQKFYQNPKLIESNADSDEHSTKSQPSGEMHFESMFDSEIEPAVQAPIKAIIAYPESLLTAIQKFIAARNAATQYTDDERIDEIILDAELLAIIESKSEATKSLDSPKVSTDDSDMDLDDSWPEDLFSLLSKYIETPARLKSILQGLSALLEKEIETEGIDYISILAIHDAIHSIRSVQGIYDGKSLQIIANHFNALSEAIRITILIDLRPIIKSDLPATTNITHQNPLPLKYDVVHAESTVADESDDDSYEQQRIDDFPLENSLSLWLTKNTILRRLWLKHWKEALENALPKKADGSLDEEAFYNVTEQSADYQKISTALFYINKLIETAKNPKHQAYEITACIALVARHVSYLPHDLLESTDQALHAKLPKNVQTEWKNDVLAAFKYHRLKKWIGAFDVHIAYDDSINAIERANIQSARDCAQKLLDSLESVKDYEYLTSLDNFKLQCQKLDEAIKAMPLHIRQANYILADNKFAVTKLLNNIGHRILMIPKTRLEVYIAKLSSWKIALSSLLSPETQRLIDEARDLRKVPIDRISASYQRAYVKVLIEIEAFAIIEKNDRSPFSLHVLSNLDAGIRELPLAVRTKHYITDDNEKTFNILKASEAYSLHTERLNFLLKIIENDRIRLQQDLAKNAGKCSLMFSAHVTRCKIEEMQRFIEFIRIQRFNFSNTQSPEFSDEQLLKNLRSTIESEGKEGSNDYTRLWSQIKQQRNRLSLFGLTDCTTHLIDAVAQFIVEDNSKPKANPQNNDYIPHPRW